tara:strand:- start:2000 stop:2269 length:270 start_codon:yes stop_codon:yes gene_type:complete
MYYDRRLAKLPTIAMPRKKAPTIPKGHPYHQDFKQKINHDSVLRNVGKKAPTSTAKPKDGQAGYGDWTESRLPKAIYSKGGTGLNPSHK